MAGNKALEKFKNSKVPKKGTGRTTCELIVYQEPNTHSKIIGTIKRNEIINWISKSICEEKEWVRCDGENNFGYIICNTMDGTCNLNMDSVTEKKEEKIENKELNNESQITQEENEMVNEALKEILEEDDKKDNHIDESNFSNSTGFGNNSMSNHNDTFDKEEDNSKIFAVKNEEVNQGYDYIFEPKNEDVFKEDNLDNLYFDGDISNLDGAIKENNKILSDLLKMMEQDKEKENNISKALDSISDIVPEVSHGKIGYLLKNFSGENDLSKKDLLLSKLDALPLGKV